ncbi:MAG: phosphotransferase [Chloroflexota bacterium]
MADLTRQNYYQIAELAADAWNLSVANLDLVSKSENVVFRLDTNEGDTLVLRIHRPGYHTLAELQSEQQWTAALNQAGLHVPVPRMLPTGAGYACIAVPGSDEHRYVGLMEWFEGVPLADILDETSDESVVADYFRQLGQIMAKIHNQATTWTLPNNFQRHAFDADGLMGDSPFWGPFWHLPQLTDKERTQILSARHAIHGILSNYGKDSNPQNGTYSLIHSDFHAGNLLINGNQLHVIDFDDSGFGWHQYDLAVALFHYQGSPLFETLYKALIAGYRSHRTLDDDAIELIPLFLLIRAMAQIGWTYARPELNKSDRLPGLIARVCAQSDELGL